jgi:prepilin-type N-terminal cleavage/methylation domain-containing protein
MCCKRVVPHVVRDDAGFTLIEALAAVVLVAIAATTVAQLVAVAMRAGSASGQALVAQQVARERMEQLKALAWTSDGVVPVSDWSTDLSVTPAAPTGGGGLGESPPHTLTTNIRGYCDFVDASGRWLSNETNPPVGAAWVRRWSIEPIAALSDTLLLQVVVVPTRSVSASAALSLAQAMNGTRLLSIRTRATR